MSDLKSAPSKKGSCEILLRLEMTTFSPKMSKFGYLGSTFLKTNVRFEISTFEIVYRQNLVNIKKMVHFDRKCLSLGIWALNFSKPMSDFKSAPSKKSLCKILLILES